MHRTVITVFFILLGSVVGDLLPLRAPCTPLNVVSPYQSTWSCSDNLYDSWPSFWTGDINGMFGMINVDGKVYRWMGPPANYNITNVDQTSVVIGATTTTYVFSVGSTGVELTVKFSTAATELDSDEYTAHDRPVTYVTFGITSTSAEAQSISLYMDVTAEAVVSNTDHQVEWSRNDDSLDLTKLAIDMQVGTTSQDFASGTQDRIDWGYAHVSVPTEFNGLTQAPQSVMNSDVTCRSTFSDGNSLGDLTDDSTGPRAASDNWIVLAVELDLSLTPGSSSHEGAILLSLDQGKSMRYFGTDLLPFWKGPDGSFSVLDMLTEAATDMSSVLTDNEAFDQSIVNAHQEVASATYATLTSLVYRQTTGAIEKTWNPVANETWVFMKEISSDGDVSTIDVIYPASPFFLATSSPETLRRMMLPLLVYANNGTAPYGDLVPYSLEWAPHHLGVWPICDLSQDKQEQMPMEESGNLLLMIAGIAYKQGWNAASVAYLDSYWTVLNGYADYLVSTLPDPGDQLCTDDFEGASPHNVNLAAKGVVALAAWSEVLYLRGGASDEDAARYATAATTYAGNWTDMAMDSSLNRYKLQYDLDDTFSLKYNILFQYILDLPNKPFSDDIMALEEVYYSSVMNEYGVPLDDRATFTKLDWSMWVAAMGSEEQFNAICKATFNFANECTDRVPLSDWTETTTPTVKGFQARPVMGGIYAKLLM